MNTLASFSNLKSLLGVAGFISAALTFSLPAAAQSESSEVEVSPEGLEILCEQFPLNSRCVGDNPPDVETGVPARIEPSVLDESPSMPDDAGIDTSPEEDDSMEVTPEEAPDQSMDEGIPPRIEPSVLDESPSNPDDDMIQ